MSVSFSILYYYLSLCATHIFISPNFLILLHYLRVRRILQDRIPQGLLVAPAALGSPGHPVLRPGRTLPRHCVVLNALVEGSGGVWLELLLQL